MKALIVDAYSSGAVLAERLKQKGLALYHAQSSHTVPTPFIRTYRPELFDANFVFGQENEATLEVALQALTPDIVLAGSEPGVILADRLAQLLKKDSNVVELSATRRNKFLMMERLKACGIPSVPQVLVESAEDIVLPTDSYPVIVKPLESAGSEDVSICHSLDAVKKAVGTIIGKANIFHLPNTSALIQKKLEGIQYMVNAVSLNGRHKITEIWQEHRLHTSRGNSIYDREMLRPMDGEIEQQIITYVKQVLDALGVRKGPSHTELFWTDEGPLLLESASRIQGGINGIAIEDALGYSHITETMQCYLEPAAFAATLEDRYALKSHVMLVNFISNETGVIKESHIEQTVCTLPSFHSLKGVPGKEDTIFKTVDLFTKPGHVYLIHEDKTQLEADYCAIRAWEKAGKLFTVGF